VQTGAVRDLGSHPLKLYFDLGLRVTVNTDNRLITDTTVSKELYLVHTEMGMPFKDIKALVLSGFKSTFRPFHEKQAAMRRVTAELARYDDDGNLRPGTQAPQSGAERRAQTSSPVATEG
jgi:adenosine deaminase